MPRMTGARLVAVAMGLVLSSCAGYRGGWESIPYIGTPPAAPPVTRTSHEAGQRSELRLPGLTLSVNLNNQSIESDTQVYAYVVPVPGYSADTGSGSPQNARVYLYIEPHDEGFVFRPLLATLSVGGRPVAALGGFRTGEFLGFKHPGMYGEPKRTADELPLSSGKSDRLFLEFPVAAPSPQARDVVLDLSRALQAPGRTPIAPIRFLPVRWGAWYG